MGPLRAQWSKQCSSLVASGRWMTSMPLSMVKCGCWDGSTIYARVPQICLGVSPHCQDGAAALVLPVSVRVKPRLFPTIFSLIEFLLCAFRERLRPISNLDAGVTCPVVPYPLAEFLLIRPKLELATGRGNDTRYKLRFASRC